MNIDIRTDENQGKNDQTKSRRIRECLYCAIVSSYSVDKGKAKNSMQNKAVQNKSRRKFLGQHLPGKRGRFGVSKPNLPQH